MGDRFALEGRAQLRACALAAEQGVKILPVWNKSNREHLTIGSEPSQTRAAAEAAVRELDWRDPYFIDADHIRRETVDRYLAHANFYTIDVADYIGRTPAAGMVEKFIERHGELHGTLTLRGIDRPLSTTRSEVERIAAKYLSAIREAGETYRHIAAAKGAGNFVTEVSIDETDAPQSPVELLIILAAICDEEIPIQTIAPKFTGRFNKGVDYVGDLAQFEKEFNEDLAVIAFAVEKYGLPASLKLSVHSGSDKFAIYPAIARAIRKFDAGLHLKTAGTTWLEEVIGLAEAGGSALALVKDIYSGALEHMDELCAPYATVLDIDRSKLPSAAVVGQWSSEQFVSALRHDQKNPGYNPNLRQLIHVGYKIAAKMGRRFLEAVRQNEVSTGKNVTENLFERHIRPVFLNGAAR